MGASARAAIVSVERVASNGRRVGGPPPSFRHTSNAKHPRLLAQLGIKSSEDDAIVVLTTV